MQLEAMEQINADHIRELIPESITEMATKRDLLRRELANSNSRNRNFVKYSLRLKSLIDIRGLRRLLINAVIESYLQGGSTRKVQDIVSRLGVEDLSASATNTGTTANTCSDSTCHPTCANGYGNCDSNLENGCEVNLNNPATCGTSDNLEE
jgi:hypothetical protein